MFRVEFFVDDKRLAGALRGLSGVAAGEPKVQPVVNATTKNGKVAAASSGDVCDMFLTYAKKHRLASFGADVLREFAVSIGRASSAYGYIRNDLFKCGVIRKIGKGATMKYAVKK